MQGDQVLNLGRNLKKHLIYVDCGNRVQNECRLGVSRCPSDAECRDLYHGYTCDCHDSMKKLERDGTCISVEQCFRQNNGKI